MPPLRLAYFGADTHWRYFTDKEIVSTPPPWNATLANGKRPWAGHFSAPQ